MATPTARAEATEAAQPTLTPTAAAVITPMADELGCAAGSTEAFVEAQRHAGFSVYCPTFLPEGFELKELSYQPLTFAPDVTPPPGAEGRGHLEVTFEDPATGASVMLFQGNVGASFTAGFWRLADEEGISPETIAYGNLEADLLAPMTTMPGVTLGAFVMSGTPDNGQILQAQEVAVDAVKEIAAGMQPVEELP